MALSRQNLFDRPDRPVPMSLTGGGENHLAYHLSALLARDLFVSQNNWSYQPA